MEAFAALGTAMGATEATAAVSGMMAVSTAVSAVGAMAQASALQDSYNAQAAANEYNAKVNERQATIAHLNEQSAAQQGAAMEEAQRRRFAMLQGSTYAGLAQSGTDLGSGSNLDILKQNELNNELDALNIRYATSQKMASLENTSQNYTSQAELNRMNASINRSNADNAMMGGFFNAGSSLLSGMTKYAYYSGTGKMLS